MKCSDCGNRDVFGGYTMCDICLAFADKTYDIDIPPPLETDELVTGINFNWQQSARESREAIAAKFPSRHYRACD